MLQIKHGDLFDNVKKNAIIVHGCNAQGKMGSGFAKLIKDKYPDAYLAYMARYNTGNMKVGEVIYKYWPEGHLIIANAITQEYYGSDGRQYVDYQGAADALLHVADKAKSLSQGKYRSFPIHLPMIGCGLAGGDKAVMMGIFKEVFRDVDATLWIKED